MSKKASPSYHVWSGPRRHRIRRVDVTNEGAKSTLLMLVTSLVGRVILGTEYFGPADNSWFAFVQ
jgi:hypothetical protein